MTNGTAAQFFDGMTAGRHNVRVALSDDRQALMIHGDRLDETLRWPLADLRALTDTSDKDRLTLTRHMHTTDEAPRDPARLVIHDADLIAWVHRTRPGLFRRDVHKGTWARVAKWTGGMVAAVALMLFVILPAMADTLARIIPIEREIAFGKSVTRQMEFALGGTRLGDLQCSNPAGEAALQTMLTRLTSAQDMKYDIALQVFDHDMVNAFAAPGGQVVILRGLLDAAESPDEVAGVLAHELGHVESRDATRHTLRAAGSAGLLTMVLGDFTGGVAIAVLGEQMLSSAYTREAEGAADGFALEMLSDAGVDATGFARFFSELADIEDGMFSMPGYLATHPVTRDRAERAETFARGQESTSPILTDADWQALKAICD